MGVSLSSQGHVTGQGSHRVTTLVGGVGAVGAVGATGAAGGTARHMA